LRRLKGCIERGLVSVQQEQQEIRRHAKEVKRIAATLDPATGSVRRRKERFQRIKRRLGKSTKVLSQQMVKVMVAFLAGLFAGPEVTQELRDNLELERWFKLPKGHERRIHGRKHAGVRLVQVGATLMPVLDAHKGRDQPFTAKELEGYKDAQPPKVEQEAVARRKVMRRARSKNRRPALLQELERRYLGVT